MLAALALLLGLLLLLHAKIPNRVGNLGSLVETFLPWFGLFVPVLLAGALRRRSASAVVALLLPVVVWVSLFGGLLGDKSHPGGDLTVASHNVGADNPDPAGTARDLAASGADVLALEELTAQARGTYEKELAKAYPYHTVQGTVGLWSKLPLSDTRPVDVRAGHGGPLAETAAEEKMATRPGAAHHGGHGAGAAGGVRGPPGVRTGDPQGRLLDGPAGRRRAGARQGGRRRAERAGGAARRPERHHGRPRVRRPHLAAALGPGAAGDGFGFSWPAGFPVARIDQILVRGVEPKSSWVLPATGSDHLPVAAGISW